MPRGAIRRDAEVLVRTRDAFLQHGFEALSMIELARAIGISRRSLYNRFPNKEAAYRALIRWLNEQSMQKGREAGRVVRESGGTPVDIISEIIDVRFGETRRMVESSPHAVELNAVAFAKCRDIAIDVAARFQQDLIEVLTSLVDEGTIRLRPSFSAADIAEALAYGARGVNQALPPVTIETLGARYRRMCEAILFGAAVQPPTRRRPAVGTTEQVRAHPAPKRASPKA